MAVKVKQGQFRSQDFIQGLVKIRNHSFKDQKVAYGVMRLLKFFEQETELVQQGFQKLVKQFAILDEKGEFVPHNGQPGTFQIIPEKVEDWKKAVKEFEDVDVELQQHPIRLEHLQGAGLTPGDMLAVECLLAPELEAMK